MSNEMFTQLPSVANAQLSDIICAVQGYVSPSSPGVSVQETLQQILNLVQSGIITTNAGNPNGSVAGTVNNLCWDSTDKLLYICTTTGSTTTAIWTPVIGQLTNGQLRIGSTGNPPAATTLTAGSNISITNGAGIITIAAIGAAGVVWTNVTGTSAGMVADNGYVANNSGLVTLTLPATAAFGTLIYVTGFGSGGWIIAQNAGQQINIGSSATTIGVTGSVASTNQFDSVALLCTVANTNFVALTGVQGILTIV